MFSQNLFFGHSLLWDDIIEKNAKKQLKKSVIFLTLESCSLEERGDGLPGRVKMSYQSWYAPEVLSSVASEHSLLILKKFTKHLIQNDWYKYHLQDLKNDT